MTSSGISRTEINETKQPFGANGLPDKWDKCSDVVVVGYGAAGATAAITVSEAGGQALILEKAPHPGGSSRVCSGGMRYPVDATQAGQYLVRIGLGSVDDETAMAFAKVWVEMRSWLEQHGARTGSVRYGPPPYRNLGAPDELDISYLESPEGYVRSAGRDFFDFLDGIVGGLGVEVMLNTPAKRLVQNPSTGEILGVIAQHEGRTISIKARKAVIMTLGGFASNPEMLATYVEEAPVKMYTAGSPYCTGDGIQMVIDVGADLWHMNGKEWGSQGFKAPELPSAHWLQPKDRSWINVNRAGKRFRDESSDYGHAKKYLEVFSMDYTNSDGYADWPNSPWYIVFDEKVRQAGPITLTERRSGSPPYITYNEALGLYKWSQGNSVEIASNWIKKADTLSELASLIEVDQTGLQETIAKYNEYCAVGYDPVFNRSPSSLAPIETPPFYAMECVVTLCNTQGGPRRNAKSQVVCAYDGSPIPRLYAGGEFGSIFGLLYPGACNLSECIVSGLITGRNAAAEQPWG